MVYYFLLRKIVFGLAVLVGIGSLLFLIQSFWGNFEERPTARIPIEAQTAQNKPSLSSSEVKPDLIEKAESKAETEGKPAEPAKIAESKTSAVLPETKVPPSRSESSALDLKTPPAEPVRERKGPDAVPVKEVKKRATTDGPAQKSQTRVSVPKPKALDSKKEEGNVVIAKSGDSIYSIAAKTYQVANTSVVDLILELNPKITDPNKLLANLKINLADISNESLIFESPEGSCKIWLGTFLKPEYSAFLKAYPALEGKEIEIIPRPVPNGETWYRVLAGIFDNREEGLKVIQDLKRDGLSPFFKGFKQKKEEAG
jgi:phage tail protein X